MKNLEIAQILENISILLEIKKENPFKIRAYRAAAEKIRNESVDVIKEAENGSLADIKGFGKALVSKITDLVENGKMEYYEKLTAEIPESLIGLTKIAGLGPKKTARLWKELGITTMDELEKACDKSVISKLKGFGKSAVESIQNGIAHKKASKGRRLQMAAKAQASEILEYLRGLESVKLAETSGDVRRFTETIRELRFVVSVNSREDFINSLSAKFNIEVEDETITSETDLELPLIINIAPKNAFYVKLHSDTGSEKYLEHFNNKLADKSFEIAEDKTLKDEKEIELSSEVDIYSAAGLQYVPPELRESERAVKAAEKGEIPQLVEAKDLKGMVHVHSNWTDGRDTIRDMALASKNLGFEYMVLCDHSQTAKYADGLSPKRVAKQKKEIEELNEEDLGIKIIFGIESDILPDGSLDYEDNILADFDIVVASIHSAFKMSKEKMTARIIKALKNPYTTMLGHPTGRLLLVRQPYEIDLKQIIDCAADYGKIIEINSNPYRLDLPWEYVIYAKDKGVKISINPDSHRTSSLEEVFVGVGVGRKGWLEAKDVVNCLNYEEFLTDICNK